MARVREHVEYDLHHLPVPRGTHRHAEELRAEIEFVLQFNISAGPLAASFCR